MEAMMNVKTRYAALGLSLAATLMLSTAAQAEGNLPLRGQLGAAAGQLPQDGMQPAPHNAAFTIRGSEDQGEAEAAPIQVVAKLKPMEMAQNGESGMPEAHETGIELNTVWRRPDDGNLVGADLTAAFPVDETLKLIANFHDTYASAKDVLNFEGNHEAVNEHALSASAGFAFALGEGSEVSAEGLWGKSGWGGRAAYVQEVQHGDWGAKVEYRAPFDDTLFAVADHANRSRIVMGLSRELGEGLSASFVGHLTRFGIKDNDNIASTVGASASLRYIEKLNGFWAGITYEFNGDYVLRDLRYQGAAPAPFSPLDMRTFEVHALSGSLSRELAEGVWADGYAGYAVDRYGPDGYFGGADIRYELAPGWAMALSAGYTQVSTEQGERGPLTTAGIKLIYHSDEAHEGEHTPPRTHYRSL
jgi:hypothetical protein